VSTADSNDPSTAIAVRVGNRNPNTGTDRVKQCGGEDKAESVGQHGYAFGHLRPMSMAMKDREEGFERKFAFDEELRFKASARRNKALGLWAAEKLGKSGADADAYAKEVVVSDIEEAGDHDVFRKIRKDFDAAGVEQSDHQIRRTMDELMAQAIEQIKNT